MRERQLLSPVSRSRRLSPSQPHHRLPSLLLEGWVSPEVCATGWLGSPGLGAAELRALELRLGRLLPPSYREFLTVSSGWPSILPQTPALSPGPEVGWLRDKHPEVVKSVAVKRGLIGEVDDPAGWQLADAEQIASVLAVSGIRAETLLALNPTVIDDHGEWEAMEIHLGLYPDVRRFRSFRDLIVEMRHATASVGSTDGRSERESNRLGTVAAAIHALEARQEPHLHQALEWLWVSPDSSAFEALRALVHDEDVAENTREYVAAVLGRVDAERSRPLLEELFVDQCRSGARAWARAGLSSLGASAVPTLLGLAGHDESKIREQAVTTLSAMREDVAAVLPTLIEIARTDPDAAVRAAALWHLPGLQEPSVLDVLAAGLLDPHPLARAGAANGLGTMAMWPVPDEALGRIEAALERETDPEARLRLTQTIRAWRLRAETLGGSTS